MRTKATAITILSPLLCALSLLPNAVGAQDATTTLNRTSNLSLDEAIRRAEANEPAFAAASAESAASLLERKNARAGLLPTATYHNQVLYTEPNGQSNRLGQTTGEPSPVFIANNAVREYASQGVFTETVGLAQLGAVKLADANAARAAAQLEVARRGLVATVVSLYFSVSSGADKLKVSERALDEANRFVDITQKRETAREAAHADVLKAQLQEQQRERELAEAKLTASKARTELAVLLFPNPDTAYDLAPIDAPPILPERTVIEDLARQNNPELRSAMADVQVSEANTYTARAALLPDLSLNVAYGIDAPQFATNGPENTKNLGYSAGATLDIPLWDWLTTERKIKENRLRQTAAKASLTNAQRRLLANLSEDYAEAAVAQAEMNSLDASVIAARESLRLTNLRYTDGESTVLEVVDAQGTLTSAENAQLEGRVRYQLALAQLQTLTGRL